MCGRLGILHIGEHLLVEFLSRSQTGIDNLYVHIRNQARKLNHLPCQRIDFYRTAHIKHTDSILGRKRCGLHHQTAGLRYGHEAANDILVRHRHRSAFLYLLAESRYHGTIGAKHISKTGGDKFGASLDFPALHRKPKALDINFRKTLGASHDIGRVDSFVGGYHHHLIHIVLDTFVRHISGAGHIDHHSFARILLHKRNMLVRRRVKYYLRPIHPERKIKPACKSHIADNRHEIQLREP